LFDRDRVSRDGLLERVESTCRFFSAYLDLVAAPQDVTRVGKVACEVALFAAFLRTTPGVEARFGVWADATLRDLADTLRGPRVVAELLWSPSRATMYGVGHGLLSRAGLRSPALDEVVRRLGDHPVRASREVSPYEALEHRWARELQEQLPSANWAPLDLGPVHPLFMSEDDAYAYTHKVFYQTDLGRRPLGPLEATEVANLSDAGVGWALARADFDLMSEFILAAIFAGATPTPAMSLGIKAMLLAWEELGCVPDRALARLGPGADRREIFLATYHTNLVAGILMAALASYDGWLERAERSPASACSLVRMLGCQMECGPGAAHPPGFAADESRVLLAEIFGPGGRETPLLVLSDELDTTTLLDLLIHRAANQRDLLRLIWAVERALEGSVVTSSICLAVEWLALLDGCLRALAPSDDEEVRHRLRAVLTRAVARQAARSPHC